jgi:hypothetical protein
VERRGWRDTERERSRETRRAAVKGHSGLEPVGQTWNRGRRRRADRRQLAALGSSVKARDARRLRLTVLRHLALLLSRPGGQPQAGQGPENGLELGQQQESGEYDLHGRNTIPHQAREQGSGLGRRLGTRIRRISDPPPSHAAWRRGATCRPCCRRASVGPWHGRARVAPGGRAGRGRARSASGCRTLLRGFEASG